VGKKPRKVKQYQDCAKRVFMNPSIAYFADPYSHLNLPEDSHLVMRVMPMPSNANQNGDIFGGWIMAQVDLAGAVLPIRISKGRVATVAVNQFVFKQPVSMGELMSFYARVDRIGTTSITIHMEVYSERNPKKIEVVKVTEANITATCFSGF
jgi:acyl-CoA thioesterase YciA